MLGFRQPKHLYKPSTYKQVPMNEPLNYLNHQHHNQNSGDERDDCKVKMSPLDTQETALMHTDAFCSQATSNSDLAAPLLSPLPASVAVLWGSPWGATRRTLAADQSESPGVFHRTLCPMGALGANSLSAVYSVVL